MSIEKKLDQIIELLTRIDYKLQSPTEDVISVETAITTKPTKGMLEFKRLIEFAARMDRTHFLTAVRNRAAEAIEIRKQRPDWSFSFTPQFTPQIDEKIAKTGAQFYKDLKAWSDTYTRAVEVEGKKTLDRAIGRLTARAKSS